MKMITALFVFLGIALPSLAELPPESYRKLQADAPEAISIKVDAAKHQNIFRKSERIEATITAVGRTATKLKVGDKISIIYRHVPLNGAVGPSPIPKLKAGESYPAWLKKSEEGHYEPAARGMSFEKVDKK